jgi:hypothetical protein
MIDFAKLRAKTIIANLLNRTVARGCTAAEAEQATIKIAELCAKYGLTAAPEPPPREAPPWEDYRTHNRTHNYYKPRGDHTRTWNMHGRWKRRAAHVDPHHSAEAVRTMLKRVARAYGLEGARAILREVAGVSTLSELKSSQLDNVWNACNKRLKQAAGDIFAEAGL